MVLLTAGFTEKFAAKRIESGLSMGYEARFFGTFGMVPVGLFVVFTGSDFVLSLRLDCASTL